MTRSRPGPVNGSTPVIVRSAPFTFRSLHCDDGWSRQPRTFSLDRLVTYSLAAVPGLRHCESADREIVI